MDTDMSFNNIILMDVYVYFLICDWACENRACGHKLHPPHNWSYLSIGIQYFHSVTCILKPTKFLISAQYFIAKQ